MSNTNADGQSNTQKELEELRARLTKSTETMEKANKKSNSTDLMNGVIKTIGTFEKE